MYEGFDPGVFAARRKRLMAKIPDALAIVRAQPEIYRNGNVAMRYRQGSDFYYLTGLEESEAIALLCPGHEEAPFHLFLRPIDPRITLWTGETTGLERACSVYGAHASHDIADFLRVLGPLLPSRKAVYVSFEEDWDFVRRLFEILRPYEPGRGGRLPERLCDLRPVLSEMRIVKDAHERRLLRAAAKITVPSLCETIAHLSPGMREYQVEADLEARFRKRGARGFSFPSIIASGPNASILHYTDNGRRIEADDLVLIDCGAEYAYYPADVTRTVPASGRFSDAQAEIYAAVLDAQEAAIAAVRPGATLESIHLAAAKKLVDHMVSLGLLRGKPADLVKTNAYKRFFPHSTSHWIGLDVHDTGYRLVAGKPRPLRSGMALTVEPGLYVHADDRKAPARYRGIGVRIEDDVLVRPGGCEVLTAGLPKAIREIEGLMASGAVSAPRRKPRRRSRPPRRRPAA